MDIDAVFLGPVAVEIIDNVFPTSIVYHQHTSGASAYNPLTGIVTTTEVDHNVNAGVLSRSRKEEGGAGEVYEITIWCHHGGTGLQFLPKTGDSFTYDNTLWRVVEIAPTYSSDDLIASKIVGRSD